MLKVPTEYKSLYTSKKLIQLITGGRGSIKSFSVALFILRLTYEKGHKILFTRYTMTSAEISIIPEFKDKIEKEHLESDFIVTNIEITNVRTGSKILFRGIKVSSGNQTANLKSIEGITTFVVDEAEEWISEEDYDKIRLSIRSINARNRVIIVMNPCNRKHFIYKKYIKDTKKIINIEGYDVEISTHPQVNHIHTYYKPFSQYLSKQFLEEIEEIRKNKVKYGNIVVGQWVDDPEGLMYSFGIKEYDYEIDLTNSFVFSFTDVSGGGDYFCTWFIAVYNNQFYVFDCIYKKEDSKITKPLLKQKIKLYNSIQNFIETNKDGAVFVNDFEMEGIPATGIYNTTTKLARIEALADKIDNFLFKKYGSDEFEKAKEHLRCFPRKGYKNSNEGYDDAPDALSMGQMYFYTNYPYLFQNNIKN